MGNAGFGEQMTRGELFEALAAMTPADKAEVVERLAPEIVGVWPGVERTPVIAGGAACIVRTRIPVWVLEGFRRLGSSDATILANYPTLRAADLVHAWAYADAHRAEMDEAIAENEAA